MVNRDAVSSVGDCILFSTADWDEPYWTNKQHTACVLAEFGWRVLYIESVGLRTPKMNSNRDWSRLWQRLWRGLRSLILGAPARSQNIWVLSPLVIPAIHHKPLGRWFNRRLLQLAIGRFVRTYHFQQPLVWTYHPFMMNAIERFKHGPVVFHCVDDLAAVPGVNANVYYQAEVELLRNCQIIFVTAQSLKERCEQYNPNTYYYPNVVDAAHFSEARRQGPLPADLEKICEPRLVYHGVLSDFKVDFELLLNAAKLRPDFQWVFIGEEREGQQSEWISRLKELSNTHFVGYRSYQRLPIYLRGMQVGLLPTLLNDYTRSMFPMKYFEYLAAGLPVVATPLAFTEQACNGLETAGNSAEFVAAVERQLKRGRLTDDEADRFVADNTWEGRTANMLKQVQLLVAA